MSKAKKLLDQMVEGSHYANLGGGDWERARSNHSVRTELKDGTEVVTGSHSDIDNGEMWNTVVYWGVDGVSDIDYEEVAEYKTSREAEQGHKNVIAAIKSGQLTRKEPPEKDYYDAGFEHDNDY